MRCLQTSQATVLQTVHIGGRYESATSFEVADVATNQKLLCDFLLVNNTNLHPVVQLSRSIGQIITFDHVSFVNALILGNLCEYCYDSYIGLHFCHRQDGSSCNQFDIVSFYNHT